MAVQLLLHPWRILVSGAVATAEPGSDDYLDSQLRVIIGTRLGERLMCPAYGVPDLTYSDVTAASIQTCLDDYGPDDITVTDVTNTASGENTDDVTVTWSRDDDEDAA